jgi:hypothetical protein
MVNVPRFNPVYRTINRPLTILGAERKLFFLALALGGGTFNFFGNLLAGLGMFVLLLMGARVATATDRQILRIVFSASRLRRRYDPGQYEPEKVVRITSDKAATSA